MTAPAVAHPTDETLAAYGYGTIEGSGAEAVARHVEACPACARRVAGLRSAGARGGAPEPVPPGLAGHPGYADVRPLGRGGMGAVYLGTNKLMGRPEVLKVVGRELLARPGAAERFLREVRAAARLHHQNIVTAYSVLEAGDLLALAMEYVPGRDLAAEVRAAGPLPVAHACHYAAQAAQGLQHAHERGLVHRDIKPGNLMLHREGARAVVKILDFGLAKAVHEAGGAPDSELTAEGRMMGTPDYVAPEQIVDAAKADIRADIYSLGCTLYYLLAGRAPFRGETLYALLHAHRTETAPALDRTRPEAPPGLAAVVAKMLAKDPARRYQTPAEVAKALVPFARPGPKPPDGPPVQVATVRPESTAVAPPPPAAAEVWGALTPLGRTRPRQLRPPRPAAAGGCGHPPPRRPYPWVWRSRSPASRSKPRRPTARSSCRTCPPARRSRSKARPSR